MTGYEYEEKCAKLLKAKGFTDVKVTPGSGDQGIDVLAKKGNKKYGVQCKYYEGNVGNKAVQEAFAGASFYDCTIAMVITNSTLTEPAKKLAKKLGVEVWEGIDAIYLQKNDAECIKKETEKAKREEEKRERKEKAARQRALLEFQQWQTAYKAISAERENNIRIEMEPLEQSYAGRKEELTLQHEKCCGDLSAQLSALRTELGEATAKLAIASWYQIPTKIKAQERIDESKAKIEHIVQDIEVAKTRYEKQLDELDQEHRAQSKQVRKKAEKETPIPPCPEIVAWARNIFSEKRMTLAEKYARLAEYTVPEIMSTIKENEKVSKHIIENKNLKELIVEYLATQPYGATETMVRMSGYFSEEYDNWKIGSLLRQLKLAGQVDSEEIKGRTYFYLRR